MTERRLFIVLVLLAVGLLPVPAARAACIPAPGEFAAAWNSYTQRFVSGGRVIDTGNGNISHSEGQGYGLLFAAAAGDAARFEAIWSWTRANLRVRGDRLFAWSWTDAPLKGPIPDFNNATDGDVLIAWALLRAADRWNAASYRMEARAIMADIRRQTVVVENGHFWLLPGANGFRNGGTVLNPSYYVFPALAAFTKEDPEGRWEDVAASGRRLIEAARFDDSGLPPDWLMVSRDGVLAPAPNLSFAFGYDAIRVPLYLAWVGASARELHDFLRHFGPKGASFPPVVDLGTGARAAYPAPAGFRAVADLVRARAGATLPRGCRPDATDKDYYSATLGLLSVLAAAEMRS